MWYVWKYIGIKVDECGIESTALQEPFKKFTDFTARMLRWLFLGGGNSNMFYFHPENWGRWSQFDEHIFQMGWFNHQLEIDHSLILSGVQSPKKTLVETSWLYCWKDRLISIKNAWRAPVIPPHVGPVFGSLGHHLVITCDLVIFDKTFVEVWC